MLGGPQARAAQRVTCLESGPLRQIFKADQSNRATNPFDWNRVGARDAERRTRVSQILVEEVPACLEDLNRTAMVFQHGYRPSDHLFTRILASAAAFEGRERARWLAAASFDRYLGRGGQPQVFGTQRCKMPWRANSSQILYD